MTKGKSPDPVALAIGFVRLHARRDPRFAKGPEKARIIEAREIVAAYDAAPPVTADAMLRITREQYPEIIQAARWMDEANGTDHFEPGKGFIVDDPDGLMVPIYWGPHLDTVEAALAGLDHYQPHPADKDTLSHLAREGAEPALPDSAVYCFVCGEETVAMTMALQSRQLWAASRFLNEMFDGWVFDPTAGYPANSMTERLRRHG
ncbi:hypothetical protein [Sphingomonas zeae]